MQNGIHFISGLPRSGSTLLAAILRQNSRVHAAESGPVASLVMGLQRQMSGENEGSVFIDDAQRRAVLKGVFDSFYADIHSTRLVFDTNRAWCAKMPLLAELHPQAKVIACVRHMPWIMDSFERLVRRNALEPSGIFRFEPGGSVYSRFKRPDRQRRRHRRRLRQSSRRLRRRAGGQPAAADLPDADPRARPCAGGRLRRWPAPTG